MYRATVKIYPHRAMMAFKRPNFSSSALPALPVDVFLPIVGRRGSVGVRAGEHHVPLALVHHAARLLVVVQRHGRGRHRLHVDGDIGFAVRRNGGLGNRSARALLGFKIKSLPSVTTEGFVIPTLCPKNEPLSSDPERSPHISPTSPAGPPHLPHRPLRSPPRPHITPP